MRSLVFSCMIFIFPWTCDASSFLLGQRKFERFRDAETRKRDSVQSLFASKGLRPDNSTIFIRVFKLDAILELWARPLNRDTYVLLRSYAICATSGNPGPKRRQGDGQVPEGLYFIDRYNPVSRFHMSLGLNYPNASDKALGGRQALGGDIFIHGNCVTIGCIPIQDDGIREVYLICAYARNAGQERVPVHIFPTRLDAHGLSYLRENYPAANLKAFWMNLKTFYDFFEKHRFLPGFSIARDGKYVIQTARESPR